MLIDTHCHLDAVAFDSDRAAVVAAAAAAGVAVLVVPSVDCAGFARVQALAEGTCSANPPPSTTKAVAPAIAFALGLHPLAIEAAPANALQQLHAALTVLRDHRALVAVGEIGLDHFVPGLDRTRQLEAFQAQLRLARDFDLPVILHVRHAVDWVARELRRYRPRSGIAHAFNGSPQQAGVLIDLGFALGMGGALTWSRARNIRRLASSLPLESLVLETDAPDIPPVWAHPGRSTPADVAGVAEVLAELRGMSTTTIHAQTGANALRVLPRLAALLQPA